MRKFLYVRSNIRKGYEQDIAVVKASDIEEAYSILAKYYGDMKKRDIYDLFMKKGSEIKILSDY